MNTATLTPSIGLLTLLRRVLLADGIVSGATRLLLAVAAGPLSDPLGLSEMFLRLVGVSLLPFAAVVLSIAARAAILRCGVWTLIGLNLLWTAASPLLLVTGWIDPTGIGIAFIIGQALIVTVFAELQFVGLRRMNA